MNEFFFSPLNIFFFSELYFYNYFSPTNKLRDPNNPGFGVGVVGGVCVEMEEVVQDKHLHVFVSYRVSTDAALAESVADKLQVHTLPNDPKVRVLAFLDKQNLKAGGSYISDLKAGTASMGKVVIMLLFYIFGVFFVVFSVFFLSTWSEARQQSGCSEPQVLTGCVFTQD